MKFSLRILLENRDIQIMITAVLVGSTVQILCQQYIRTNPEKFREYIRTNKKIFPKAYAQLFQNESIGNVGRGGGVIGLEHALEFVPHLNITKVVLFAIEKGANQGTKEITRLVAGLLFGSKALQNQTLLRKFLFEYLKAHSVQNLPEPIKVEIVCVEALIFIAKLLKNNEIPYKDKQDHTRAALVDASNSKNFSICVANLMHLCYNGDTKTFNSCYQALLDGLISGLNSKVIDKRVGRSIFNHLKDTNVYLSPLFLSAIALSRYERLTNWLESMSNITNVTSINRGGYQATLETSSIQIYAEPIYVKAVPPKKFSQLKKKIVSSLSRKGSAFIGFYIIYKILTTSTSEHHLQTQPFISQTNQRVAKELPESGRNTKIQVEIENSPRVNTSNRKKITFKRGKRKSSLKNKRGGKTVYFRDKLNEWNQENDISDNKNQRLLE